MFTSSELILNEALKLPAEMRETIAVALLDSLESEIDCEAGEAWSEELQR